jgi:hypothetical protein
VASGLSCSPLYQPISIRYLGASGNTESWYDSIESSILSGSLCRISVRVSSGRLSICRNEFESRMWRFRGVAQFG